MSVMGALGVGKSALTLRFCHDEWHVEHDPTIEDTYRKTIKLEPNLRVELEILDTAGENEFSTMIDSWIMIYDAFLLVYDITNSNTLETVQQKYKKIFCFCSIF